MISYNILIQENKQEINLSVNDDDTNGVERRGLA